MFCHRDNQPLILNFNESTDPPNTHIETFITYDKIFKNCDPDRVQDFDLDEEYLYVHPISAYGLYQYSLTDDTLRELVSYSSGNYIAHDSHYVFYEISSYNIYRFNLIEDTTDLICDLSSLDYTNIEGMDAYKHKLYVFMHSQQSGDKFIAKFDLNGSYIESIPYPRYTMHMAIYNNIVYAIYYPDQKHVKFSRFSLETESFFEDAEFPTENWVGIRILNDKLYFTDYQKGEIEMISMSEIK